MMAQDTSGMQGWVSRYDGGIAYIDDQIGRIQDYLEAGDLLENTIVIVTADHGEMWGEHGLLGHVESLYLQTVHVPLFISFPRRVPGAVRVPAPVSLRDIPRTVGELAGIEDLGAFPGSSLVRLWTNPDSGMRTPVIAELEPSPNPSRRAACAELDRFGRPANPRCAPSDRGAMASVVLDKFQYIRNGDDAEELYDITIDPTEDNNLAGRAEFVEILTRARASLDSILHSASGGGA